MVTYRDLITALHGLGIPRARPVIAHVSLSAFGIIQGGAESVLTALLANFDTLVMPTFTYKTMLTPESGPPDNGMLYGSRKDQNCMAEFFRLKMPADRLMGVVPEVMRRHPQASRSMHPILSFAGVNAERVLKAQTIVDPLGPIQTLMEENGWVVLLGVDHTVNTSIHLGERQAGRKQFVRWALTPRGVQECPGFPGCSDGFRALAPSLEDSVRRLNVGQAQVQALPLEDLVEKARARVVHDPLALLCECTYCERCLAVRASLPGG